MGAAPRVLLLVTGTKGKTAQEHDALGRSSSHKANAEEPGGHLARVSSGRVPGHSTVPILCHLVVFLSSTTS